MNEQRNDEILTPEEAAAYLKISRRSLMDFYRDGKIKGMKLSYRLVRFLKEDLDEWLRKENATS